MGSNKDFENNLMDDMILCIKCNAAFTFEDLVVHHNTVHAERKLNCRVCDMPFKETIDLENHLRDEHFEFVKVVHKCLDCNKRFNRLFQLARHRNLFHSKPKFECEHCKNKFRRRDQIKRHCCTKQDCIKRKFCCTKCDKSFERNDHLDRHVRQMHFKGRFYDCSNFEVSFKLPDHLDHLMRHESQSTTF